MELLYAEVIEKLDYGLDLSALMNSKFRSISIKSRETKNDATPRPKDRR